MTTSVYTITAANVGNALTPANGFLTSLSLVSAGPYQTPDYDQGQRCWTSGYLTLQGANDSKPVFSASPQSGGLIFRYGQGGQLVQGNFPYDGDLMVVAVPAGSQWTIGLWDGM